MISVRPSEQLRDRFSPNLQRRSRALSLKICHLVASNLLIQFSEKQLTTVKSTAKFEVIATIWQPAKLGRGASYDMEWPVSPIPQRETATANRQVVSPPGNAKGAVE